MKVFYHLNFQLEIERIQKKNDALIEQTENYEKTIISEYESCETKEKVKKITIELDKKIKVVDHLNKLIDLSS